MNQEFFKNLPSEIIINILSRLPLRTIISCKCVCKSWLNLLETNEFVKSHLSTSVPGLVVWKYKFFEFEDALNLEHHELHYIPITDFDDRAFVGRPHADMVIQGSANGLLLFCDFSTNPDALYICNPITRDYVQLPCPQESVSSYPQVVTYGFGVSKITGQHKVVRIFHECTCDQETNTLPKIPKSGCQVYTLGTGSWRSIASCAPFKDSFPYGKFLNGNLHWLVTDLNGCQWISCFDLETELFSTLSSTPALSEGVLFDSLFVLGDRLCLSDYSFDNEIVIWSMKEHGQVEKFWTKEFVMSKPPHLESYEVVHPIKVFKDGDILMAWEDYFLMYYSNKTKTTHKVDMFELHSHSHSIDAILHTPSFLSLKSFSMENVSSF